MKRVIIKRVSLIQFFLYVLVAAVTIVGIIVIVKNQYKSSEGYYQTSVNNKDFCAILQTRVTHALGKAKKMKANKMTTRRMAYQSLIRTGDIFFADTRQQQLANKTVDALFVRIERAMANSKKKWNENPSKPYKPYEKTVRVMNKAINDSVGYTPEQRQLHLYTQLLHQNKHFVVMHEKDEAKAKKLLETLNECLGKFASQIEDQIKTLPA